MCDYPDEQTDGDSSYYCSQNGVNTGWLQYDFTNPVALSKYAVERLNGHGNAFSPVDWTFQVGGLVRTKKKKTQESHHIPQNPTENVVKLFTSLLSSYF